MDKKNDTANIITVMASLAALDATGILATIVLLVAAAVIIKREFGP